MNIQVRCEKCGFKVQSSCTFRQPQNEKMVCRGCYDNWTPLDKPLGWPEEPKTEEPKKKPGRPKENGN